MKLYVLIEQTDLDIICIQETWLTEAAIIPQLAGYRVIEQRRSQGNRGGIAIYIR
jgi:exonuclease III